MKVSRNPETNSLPKRGYSHGVEAQGGRTLYISGQIPERNDGQIPPDFEGKCEIVWHNIREVLKASGMEFKNLVKVTTYLTHQDQAESDGRIRRQIIGDVQPALTVVVAQTLDSRWLLEIEAVAVADE